MAHKFALNTSEMRHTKMKNAIIIRNYMNHKMINSARNKTININWSDPETEPKASDLTMQLSIKGEQTKRESIVDRKTLDWSIMESPPGVVWTSMITRDVAGKYLVAISNKGLYMSSDYGANWAKTFNIEGAILTAVTTNLSGKYMAVACIKEPNVNNVIAVYTSTDGGGTWTNSLNIEKDVNPPPCGYINSITTNNVGSRFYAVTTNGLFFLSVDYGATWHKSDAIPNNRWTAITSDDSGLKLRAVSRNITYTSDNGGVTWSHT